MSSALPASPISATKWAKRLSTVKVAGGEDPGHLGALHLGTEALGDRQRRQIEGKVQTRTVIPVGETGLVDRQHLPRRVRSSLMRSKQ